MHIQALSKSTSSITRENFREPLYAPGGDTYASESTHGGGPVTFEGDLLPEVLVGLERAWAQGLLGDSQDLADYRLGGMNIGWEVPGVFDAAVELWDLELLAVPK